MWRTSCKQRITLAAQPPLVARPRGRHARRRDVARARAGRGLEAGAADQPDRALGRRRLDRPVTRVTASELEKSLGQTIVIINQPGASGAIGTNSCLNAARDGYTWTVRRGAGPRRLPDAGHGEGRHHRLAPVSQHRQLSVLGVGINSPYKTAKDFIDAMKAHPGAITIATAGVTSGGHAAMDLIAKAADVTYRHVTYDGGLPAVIATVSGETDATTPARLRGSRHDPRQEAAARSAPSATSRWSWTATAPFRRCRTRCPASPRRPTISASSCRTACRTR